jgi:hypothetical protein
MRLLPSLSLVALALARTALAADFPTFRAQEIDPHVGNVCYAVTVADVDGDGRPDVVAVTEDAVVWFANPGWEKHTIIQQATQRDNVCIQAHDIDGDGRIDFALGAGWKPTDTQGGGTLQWLKRDGDGPWKVIPIASEPTVHRIRWGRVSAGGKPQLVVAPLQGRGTKGPQWNDGQGVRLMVFSVPDDPVKGPWPMEVADDTLHTVHNLQLVDFDDDGKDEILLASWEGVFLLGRDSQGHWSKTQLGSGNQQSQPFKGSSEIKLGRLANGSRYIATIEPWHGFQVVVYTPPPSGKGLWDRHVVDEPVQWGHAVWCANVDADADDELIIGQRDKNNGTFQGPAGPGVRIYDPKPGASALEFNRHLVDEGGVAVEDLVAADLDGDGRNDLVAGGRATHNVKIYWNRGGGGD